MEIKAVLNKPYNNDERADFIVENNHKKGYEIKEYADRIEAWGLTAEEQAQADLENQKLKVRFIRNSYLDQYVDPYQLVLRWGTLTQVEQADIKNYRQYLLDYTEQEDWWESNPMTFDEWKQSQAVLEEME